MAGLLLTACLAAASWVAVSALSAGAALERVPQALSRLEAAADGHDPSAAASAWDDVRRDAATARDRTDDVVWRAAARLPGVGDVVRTTRGLAVAADDLAVDVLPAVVQAAGVDPATLARDGGVDLDVLARLAPAVTRAGTSLAAVRRDVDALPHATGVAAVDTARSTLLGRLADVAPAVDSAALTVRLLPPMLGADGPRTYFLAFQTPAEARGTGGFVGAYGILRADRGRVQVERLGDNTDLAWHDAPVTDLGAEFGSRYDQYGSLVRPGNANVTPDFPTAARILAAMWERQSGRQVDGVVATDPVALSYLLEPLGGVVLPGGERLAARDVVPVTMSSSYVRFAHDNEARKAYLQKVSGAAFDTVLRGVSGGQAAAVLPGLRRAAAEGRLLIASLHDDEQALLATTPLSGALPRTQGPFAGVVVNNAGADKLDYYLDRTVRWTAGPCTGPQRSSTVEVVLTNTAPAGGRGLPDYVVGRSDTHAARGAAHSLVSLYTTYGAGLRSAEVDGRPVTVASETEQGRPVLTADVAVPAAGRTVLRFHLVEPTVPGAPTVLRQPLVRPLVLETAVPTCSR